VPSAPDADWAQVTYEVVCHLPVPWFATIIEVSTPVKSRK